MKKILLFAAIAVFTACSVEDDLGVYESEINDVNVTYADDGCTITAGEDKSRWIEISEAASLESWDEVRKLFANMLDPGVPRNGVFDPSIWEIITRFNDAENGGLGEYTTIYTVTEGECSDSVTLTVRVVPDGYQEPTCEITAGEDNSITITEAEASAIPSWDEVRKLYLNLLSEGVRRDGTFDPRISAIINAYTGVGEYSTVYTVGEGDCTDSVTLTVIVIEEQSTPPCNISAGPDNIRTITESQAAAIPSWDEVRKLYLNLLGPGVPRNGSFDPSITNIINDFQAHRTGDFSTTYTVTNGECSDSVILTIRVIPD